MSQPAGTTVVASVLTEDTPDDFDAGIVFSRDGGPRGPWGGVVADEGGRSPRRCSSTEEGVIVGSNQGGGRTASRAGPSWPWPQVRTSCRGRSTCRRSSTASGCSCRTSSSVDGEWVVAGYVGRGGRKGKAHPTAVLWRSGDRGRHVDQAGRRGGRRQDIVLKQLGDRAGRLAGTSWARSPSRSIFDQYDPLWLRSTDGGARSPNGQEGASRPTSTRGPRGSCSPPMVGGDPGLGRGHGGARERLGPVDEGARSRPEPGRRRRGAGRRGNPRGVHRRHPVETTRLWWRGGAPTAATRWPTCSSGLSTGGRLAPSRCSRATGPPSPDADAARRGLRCSESASRVTSTRPMRPSGRPRLAQ